MAPSSQPCSPIAKSPYPRFASPLQDFVRNRCSRGEIIKSPNKFQSRRWSFLLCVSQVVLQLHFYSNHRATWHHMPSLRSTNWIVFYQVRCYPRHNSPHAPSRTQSGVDRCFPRRIFPLRRLSTTFHIHPIRRPFLLTEISTASGRLSVKSFSVHTMALSLLKTRRTITRRAFRYSCIQASSFRHTFTQDQHVPSRPTTSPSHGLTNNCRTQSCQYHFNHHSHWQVAIVHFVQGIQQIQVTSNRLSFPFLSFQDSLTTTDHCRLLNLPSSRCSCPKQFTLIRSKRRGRGATLKLPM